MSTKFDATIGIEKSRFRGGPAPRHFPWLVPGGVRGEVNLPPEGRRFGRKEEKKKRRKEVGR